ncbi:ribonuclease I [Afifella sp. IM 167]|nr:ribonuclease I [Afifella sp. IM 167]
MLAGILSSPSFAQQVELDGYFIALSACEATKKKDTENPGNVRLEVMRAYEMVARNSTPGTHYQVKVPGAPQTEARWVPMNCGAYAPAEALVRPAPSNPTEPTREPPSVATLAPDSIEYVLAASWEPAFCATAAGTNKPECTTLRPGRFDATHFALHGLWPDDLDDRNIFPCYCDRGGPVSCAGSQPRDEEIALDANLLAALKVVMPGVQSGLHLHEWPKHGACYEDDRTDADKGADPDEYFRESLLLMNLLNASPVRMLFAQNLGKVLQRSEIEDTFDTAFGAGASDRLLIRCAKVGGENVISELWIGLKGNIGEAPDLGALIRAAPPSEASSNQTSCNSGRVVKVE